MTRLTLTAAAGVVSLLLVPLSARQLPSSGDPVALLASGDQLASEARFDEALVEYRRALAGAPASNDARAGAGVSYPNRSVVVLDLDAPSALLGFKLGGIVGHRFLRDYRVSIDLQRARLGLQTLD